MFDPKLAAKFADKEYREEYVQSHVHSRIAYQMRALRAQAGMTQAQFATKLGKPQSVVSRLENPEYGKVSVQTLLDVAAALDIALQVKFCGFPEFVQDVPRTTNNDLKVLSYAEAKPIAWQGSDVLARFAQPSIAGVFAMSSVLAISGDGTKGYTQGSIEVHEPIHQEENETWATPNQTTPTLPPTPSANVFGEPIFGNSIRIHC